MSVLLADLNSPEFKERDLRLIQEAIELFKSQQAKPCPYVSFPEELKGKEACKMLKISTTQLSRLVKRRSIKKHFRKEGGNPFYLKSELKDYLGA